MTKTVTFADSYYNVTFTADVVTPVKHDPNKRDVHWNRFKSGWVTVSGTIVKGTVKNRLFNHVSVSPVDGDFSMDMPREAYEKGHYSTSHLVG